MLTQKYRPASFADVTGQSVAKSILQAISKHPQDAPRSLVFSGERGLGKTTCSRILVKSVNCKTRSGDACNGCEACKDTKHLYVELDSGVVGNVDTMRDIRDTLTYAVSNGYRVVNLDETQLVSKAGQGTLLKVLEEAPSGVFFVMCTTNPELLLPTIISRSLVVPFEPLSQNEMTQHLSKIAELEGIQASEDTLNRAARRVNGHVRDGIQQLEMIKLIGEQGYKDTFKIIDEQFTVLLDLFIKGDLEKAKQVVLDITSNPVIYIDQDFSVYIRRILDDVYLNKNKDNRLKDIVNHWLRMHRYLKSTNDWYLFLMSLGGILGKGGGDGRPTRPVNRFSR